MRTPPLGPALALALLAAAPSSATPIPAQSLLAVTGGTLFLTGSASERDGIYGEAKPPTGQTPPDDGLYEAVDAEPAGQDSSLLALGYTEDPERSYAVLVRSGSRPSTGAAAVALSMAAATIAVPEPGSLLLFGSGLCLLGLAAARRARPDRAITASPPQALAVLAVQPRDRCS